MLTAWLEDEALPFLVKNWQGWSRMLWEVAGIIWGFYIIFCFTNVWFMPIFLAIQYLVCVFHYQC